MPLPSYITCDVSIANKTYYKMGGIARYFAEPENLSEVKWTLNFCKEKLLPCALLGSGSNSVYADGIFEGVILSLSKLSRWHWETSETLYVEAGVTNTEIAEICAAANRAGASWMYRMPGLIGGTIRMNARCYGGEISQIAQEIITLTSDGELITFKNNEVFQGYKQTYFMDYPHVVVGVRLYFPNIASAEALILHMHKCEEDRHSKSHFYLPSCGSTFKNNYTIGKPSGKIFDELGLKGKKIGEACISNTHANFIWNSGYAKTEDMLNLAAFMREEAQAKLNAELELEVQPVGCFSPTLFNRCGMEKLGKTFSDEDGFRKWVGLFKFPKECAQSSIIYPKVLLSSPFFEYHHSPLKGLTEISVNLIQLIPLDEARKNPNKLFIKWETHCYTLPTKLFPLEVYTDVEKLWEYSVSEIFFACPQNPKCYLEFEITPNEKWIALKFEDIRKRSPGTLIKKIKTFSKKIKNNITQKDNYSFGMEFTYEDLSYVLDNENKFSMQCALSLGNSRYYLAPYWLLDLKNKENPNFHQPHRFWEINL